MPVFIVVLSIWMKCDVFLLRRIMQQYFEKCLRTLQCFSMFKICHVLCKFIEPDMNSRWAEPEQGWNYNYSFSNTCKLNMILMAEALHQMTIFIGSIWQGFKWTDNAFMHNTAFNFHHYYYNYCCCLVIMSRLMVPGLLTMLRHFLKTSRRLLCEVKYITFQNVTAWLQHLIHFLFCCYKMNVLYAYLPL